MHMIVGYTEAHKLKVKIYGCFSTILEGFLLLKPAQEWYREFSTEEGLHLNLQRNLVEGRALLGQAHFFVRLQSSNSVIIKTMVCTSLKQNQN